MTICVRDAALADTPAVVGLLEQLGHPISPETVERQLTILASTGCDRVLVAERGGTVVGVLSLHWAPLLHRDRPMGRITALVVNEREQGQGIGGRLVAEAEHLLREAGCSAVEVTSNVRRAEAHKFYLGLGYGQPSSYFRRCLDELQEPPTHG